MPATTRQMAEIAGVSEQTVRNYTRRYGELLSPQARGETGARLFDDQDVQVFCSIAAMYRANMPPQEIIERVKGGDVFVDHTTPQQATPNATQSQKTALDAPQAPIVVYADLQRQIDALRRSQDVLLKAAVLWGALWGAVAALAFAAFVELLWWLLYVT
jgi:DNA-binding transcriptional MerR regulator